MKQKTFPQGCIANDTLYFNSENAMRLFSNTYKDKISQPLVGKSNVHVSQEEYETRPKQLQNPDQIKKAIERTDRLHLDKDLGKRKI